MIFFANYIRVLISNCRKKQLNLWFYKLGCQNFSSKAKCKDSVGSNIIRTLKKETKSLREPLKKSNMKMRSSKVLYIFSVSICLVDSKITTESIKIFLLTKPTTNHSWIQEHEGSSMKNPWKIFQFHIFIKLHIFIRFWKISICLYKNNVQLPTTI